MCDLSMRDVYQATIAKEDAMFAQGYSVVVMWQCEWERFKKEDETVRQLVESFELVSRLQPRDAFFGGRTNAIQLYHVVIDGEIICYLDFCSLPLDQQKLFLPSRTSRHHSQPRKYGHFLLLWTDQMQDLTPLRTVPFRLTLP